MLEQKTMVIDPTIFKAYDIRGIYPSQITEEGTYLIGRAIATLFLQENTGKKITIGVSGDMRISTPALKESLQSGLLDTGVDIVDLGLASTPTFYHAVANLGLSGGVQISASHNPAQYNGFKIVRQGAVPMSGDTGIQDIYHIIANESFAAMAASKGQVSSVNGITEKATGDYVAMVDTKNLKKFKIVVDTANAMGALDYDELFKQIDAQLIPMNFELDGTFPSHEADPLKAENREELCRKVIAEKADFGIAADGDSDRIFIVDENGEVIPSEVLYSLLAKQELETHPTGTFTEEVRFGRTVKDVFANSGAELIPTPVGHSLIKKIMVNTDALLGGEVSGHFYFKFPFGVFEAPVYLVLKFMEIATKANKLVSEIVEPYKKYANSGEVNTKVESRESVQKKITELKETYHDGKQLELDGIKVEYDQWWFIVRASNTEPVIRLIVEAETQEMMEQKRDEILAILRK
jgi:phosphomannomutase